MPSKDGGSCSFFLFGACTFVNEAVHTHVHSCAYGGHRATSGIIPLDTANEPQKSACLCLPSDGVVSASLGLFFFSF